MFASFFFLFFFISLHLRFCCQIKYILFFCVCLLPSPHFPLSRDQESSSFMCEMMLIVCRQRDLEGMLCYRHEFINMHTSFKPQTSIPQAECAEITLCTLLYTMLLTQQQFWFGISDLLLRIQHNMVTINTLCL